MDCYKDVKINQHQFLKAARVFFHFRDKQNSIKQLMMNFGVYLKLKSYFPLKVVTFNSI